MHFNQDIIKGNWRQFKGELQKSWGQLTDDEVEQTKGEFNSVYGLLQKKYGAEKEGLKDKLSQFYSRFEEARDKVKSDRNQPNQNFVSGGAAHDKREQPPRPDQQQRDGFSKSPGKTRN